jgi:hypothetical protein
MLLLLSSYVAAGTGPGARGYTKQLDQSGGVLPDTWIDLLLVLQ